MFIDPTGLFSEYAQLTQWMDTRGNWDWVSFTYIAWDGDTATAFMASDRGFGVQSFTIGVDGAHMVDGHLYVRQEMLRAAFDSIAQQPGLIHRPVRDSIVTGVAAATALKLPGLARRLFMASPTVASGGTAVTSYLVKNADRLQRTATVMNNVATRPYIQSTQFIQQIMLSGSPMPDPGTAAGLKWVVPGTFNGSQGVFDLVINPDTHTILHFLFQTR